MVKKRNRENRENCECSIIGSFIAAKSIKEGIKRDLQPSDFQFKETRQAYIDMLAGLFNMDENYLYMLETRGVHSNVGVKINYLIKNAN